MGAARELTRASPTSLAVTFEALRRGGGACETLGECLAMEFRMAQAFLRHPDFVRGVGAVLTKGAEPAAWAAPPSAAQVDAFFAPGEGGELRLVAA